MIKNFLPIHLAAVALSFPLLAACGSAEGEAAALAPDAGAEAASGGSGGTAGAGGSGGTTLAGGSGGAGNGGAAGIAGAAGGDAGSAGGGGDDAGVDGSSCPGSLASCGSDCVDLQSDPAHCGGCGNTCGEGESCCQGACLAAIAGDAPPLATLDACGRLAYGRYANQGQSDRVHVLPDYSFAGYERGGVAIPDVPVAVTVHPGSGDDGARIQAALDEVADMPLVNGFRGAVLLTKGAYQISAPLRIHKTGVVLRGEGQGTNGTVITAGGTDQYVAVEVAGSGSGLGEVSGSRTPITTSYVAVGARKVDVESAAGFSPGDAIAVLRTPNQAWIDALGMDAFGWTPGGYAIAHERRIEAIEGNTLTLDIPIVDAMESGYGGGAVFRTDVQGRIRHCGVEDLRLESTYASDTDEDHAWTGIELKRTTNSWVRRVTVRYFGYSAVHIDAESNFNTVQDTAMLDPKSEITGGRRYPFNVSDGVGNLFQRCYVRHGRHNFVTGARVTGPNVWLDCLAEDNHADDGPHHRWATGLLFDNTRSEELRVQNRQESGTGHGWAGAQVMFWNARAESVVCDAPKGAMNYAVGVVGQKDQGSWAPEEPFGLWESEGAVVEPRSLYLKQLEDRLGPGAVEAVTLPAQRQGRIWAALRDWAGDGRLEDHL